MIPKKLKEENPRKKFYRRRIRKWPEIIGPRFFSHNVGNFFRVTKAWSCMEYCKSAIRFNPYETHWFHHYTIEIVTDKGERLILRKLPFDLEHAFDKQY